ncbi:MAG: endolytic transglycosylase MltG [Sphaerochaeta sp.]|nr:endolytic transglycosylase MltG [Sphaerochaeta sp.]
MSEQKTKPTNQSKSPQTTKGKNSFSEHVTLGNGEEKEKPVISTTRKKPSVSHATMHVDMPGVLKGGEEKRKPGTKPKPVAKRQSPAQRPSSKPKKPVTPAVRKTSPSVKGKNKVPSTKKRATPIKRKPVARVVPPKIGSRRGYRPSLAFRLRLPVFLIAFAVCALALFFSFRKGVGPVGRYVTPSLQSPFMELTIEPGMSARSVSLLLKEQGIVDDDVSLLQFFIKAKIATSLRSGTFVMEKGMDYETIGKQLTVQEGELVLAVSPSFTLEAIDRYLHNRGYAKEGSFLASAEALKEEHSLSFAEGWLLSGEYVVSSEDTASALAQAMFDAMLAVVQPHVGSGKVAQYGLEQTLIVASMIQAETQNVEEMPLIASVIYNRLEAGEPLGIDATTRYELEDWENPIPKKALEEQTPYNTRRKVGLPPSGICSPSKAAVEAALYPLESPYFYYLHGLDKRLYPAVTYEEHKENIKAYR